MKSRVVLTDNTAKHKSRLVKALQSVNLEDFSTKPDGVWGSLATIRCGDVIIKSTDLDLEFDIPFDDNLEANEGEITVYNLSNNTINKLKPKSKLSIEAGYTGDVGVIFSGYITKVSTHREGADKVITIKIIDDIGEKESLNLSYNAGTWASHILDDLLKRTGLPIAKKAFARDWQYENDTTIDEPLESAIKKFSEVCGVSTFTSKGKIYSCKVSNVSNDIVFNVNEGTGMIDTPSQFEETIRAEDYEDTIEGYEVEMLLQHRIAVGALVNLKSEKYNGQYYVKSGRHTFNESDCITTAKVISKITTAKVER